MNDIYGIGGGEMWGGGTRPVQCTMQFWVYH